MSEPHVPPQDLTDLIHERRRALYGRDTPPHGEAWWGLALSGGGIRSATFCWGLLRALAKQRQLLRFDILSTVSGGGYVGAALGRLFDRARSPQELHDMAAALGEGEERQFGRWLRDGARFLQSGGKLELPELAALFVRNLLAIHLELAQLALSLGLMLLVGNLLWWHVMPGSALGVAWLLVPPLLGLVLWLTLAYWNSLAPAQPEERRGAGVWVVVLLGALAALALPLPGLAEATAPWRQTIWWLALALGSALGLARLGVALRQRRVARQQQHLPAQLLRRRVRGDLGEFSARALEWAGMLALLGAVDWLAWQIAFGEWLAPQWLGGLAAALGVSRAVWPRLAALMPGVPKLLHGAALHLANATGLLLLALLVVAWMVLALKLCVRLEPQAGGGWGIATVPGLWLASLGLLAMAALQGLTQHRLQVVNLSSLHSFYRSRLTRSFLGGANPARFPAADRGDAQSMMGTPRAKDGSMRFVEPDADDDVDMGRYAPQRHGGPVHLVNVCLNETQNLRGGVSNIDRRGQLCSVAPGALARVGLEGWRPLPEGHAHSLGTWMAVSGGALAPGLGNLTRAGIAALLTMSGLRLGMWWLGAARWRGESQGAALPPTRRELLGRELLGAFDRQRPAWFLSDGGHFENTGAYALLAQGCRRVVVADCGADPQYGFVDLENLVRLARIDLQVEVNFLKPKPGQRLPRQLGSLDDLASAESEACIAVAELHYLRQDWTGLLVVVKPNVFQGLPIDLVNFKRKHPDFPQQATTDQFFSEAQWESYHKLGEVLGEALGGSGLLDADRPWQEALEIDDGRRATALGQAAAGMAPPPVPVSRFGPTLAKPVVAAGVGAGALLTAGLTVWSLMELWRPGADDANLEPLGTLAPLHGQWDGAPASVGPMAAQWQRLGATHCIGEPDAAALRLRASPYAQCLLADTLAACAVQQPLSPVCRSLLAQAQALRACLATPSTPPQPAWGGHWPAATPLLCAPPRVGKSPPD